MMAVDSEKLYYPPKGAVGKVTHVAKRNPSVLAVSWPDGAVKSILPDKNWGNISVVKENEVALVGAAGYE
jgi:hypothetical protein